MSASGPISLFKTRGPLDPIADAAICVHRPELDQMLRAAMAPTVDAYLAVLSSRQTGKTTLLYQVRSRLRARGFGVAFIDLAIVLGQPEPALYNYVASQINSELQQQLTLPRPRNQAPVPLPNTAIEFRSYLLELARQVHTPRLVVLIDEVEAVSGKAAESFFGTIRNVFSSRQKEDEVAFAKYLFVIAGARELHRLSEAPTSPLNIAERIYLQDLSLSGVEQLVANFARAAIVAPPETAQWLYNQTSGHPYLTQKLCTRIEQLHPGVITPEIVQRAGAEVVKTDDHFRYMLNQVDAEPAARLVLEQIMGGKPVGFNRMRSEIARLELLGAIRDSASLAARDAGGSAIRDAGQCAIRNPIYFAALRTHLNVTPAPAVQRRWKRWVAPAIAVVALLVIAINLPFLFTYTSEVLWAQRSVNDRFVTQTLNANFIIHYDRVLSVDSDGATSIAVDLEGANPPAEPVVVTFLPGQTDMRVESTARRTFDQAFQQVRFSFTLNQSGLRGLRYNPFDLKTDHRTATLIFQSASDESRREIYNADFVVDYYSNFMLSLSLTLGGIFGSIGSFFANLGRIQHVIQQMMSRRDDSDE